MIEVFDNFLSEDDYKDVVRYCMTAPYLYGEVDHPGAKPTGMIHSIDETSWIYELFRSKLDEIVDITEHPFDRMYVNCFAAGESPDYHVDGRQGYTFLFYANQKWNLKMQGETQFLIDNQITGVLPYSNRMVQFDATLRHRATSFTNRHRFTLAVKYGSQ